MTPEQLKRWRKDNGFSQQALADILQVAKVTVYRWERPGSEDKKAQAKRAIPPYLELTLDCVLQKRRKEESKKAHAKRPHATKPYRKEPVPATQVHDCMACMDENIENPCREEEMNNGKD